MKRFSRIVPVLCVPVWGLLCMLILHCCTKIHKKEKSIDEVGSFKVKEDVYKSISVEGEDEKNILPLEEVLIMNAPDVRRNMIMDLLNDDPSQYIDLLHQAKMNEDVDVVHYATTAMAELEKEYDIKLQKFEQKYSAHPEQPEIIDAYCNFLRQYIELVGQGQMETMQRIQYAQLLQKKNALKIEKQTCVELVDNYLHLQEYGNAKEILNLMKKHWPKQEEYWLLKVKYYAIQKRGKELWRTLREMEEQQIYLSSESKEELAFWKQNIERNHESEGKEALEKISI